MIFVSEKRLRRIVREEIARAKPPTEADAMKGVTDLISGVLGTRTMKRAGIGSVGRI